jgi:AcrR family transcriptional regulator
MSQPTRDRILDAAERLLGRLGYQKMTMDDIAREAGIGKRTIYLHFPSKDEVALSRIDRLADRLEARLRMIATSDGTPTSRIRRMLIERVLYRFDSVRGYYHSLDEIFQSLRPAYMARRERYFAQEAAVFAEVLAEGHASREFACDDPLTTSRTLLVATNALLPSAMSVRELGKRTEVEAEVTQIAELLLHGLIRREAAVNTRHRRARAISS